MDDRYQEYLVNKAECGGGSDFPTFEEWLDPQKAERERDRERESRYRIRDEFDTWHLY